MAYLRRPSPLLAAMLPLVLLLAPVNAEVKAYISTASEYNTECKTSPHSLAPNKIAYSYDETLNVTCWTRGTKIMGDNLWLKSQAECYVTQYDLTEYAGDYTTDLAYCGRASEEESLTTEDATLQYKTECRICPDIDCDIAAYLPEETDLTLTCWTDAGQIIIDDPVEHVLDNCGPIPFLEAEWHNNENGTSEIDKRDAAPLPHPLPEEQSAKYLINVTVGEEYAYCRKCPKETCKSQQRYIFNQEVWLQCLVENNGTWWSETTDFCYVKNSDFWQSPEGDYYKNPLCEYFEDPNSDD